MNQQQRKILEKEKNILKDQFQQNQMLVIIGGLLGAFVLIAIFFNVMIHIYLISLSLTLILAILGLILTTFSGKRVRECRTKIREIEYKLADK